MLRSRVPNYNLRINVDCELNKMPFKMSDLCLIKKRNLK